MPYGFGSSYPDGPLVLPIATKSGASYSADNDDVFIKLTHTAGITLTFPKADRNKGRVLMFIANQETSVTPASGDQINDGGAGNPDVVNANTVKSYVSDGVDNWIPWNSF